MTSRCDWVVYEGKKKDGINGLSHSCVRLLISPLLNVEHIAIDKRVIAVAC